MTKLKRTTYQPKEFSEKEMQGFSLFSHKASAIAISNRLTGSQFRLWHYLMMLDPFADQTSDGERIYHDLPSPVDIGRAIGANPKTVEKDMRRLEQLGLYTKRITGWQGYNLTAEDAHRVSATMKQAKVDRVTKPPVKQHQEPPVNPSPGEKSLKPLPDKRCYLAPDESYLTPDESYLTPDESYLAPDGSYLAPKQNAVTTDGQAFQAFSVPDHTIQTIQIDQITQTAAPADAAPAPHPGVCIPLEKEEEVQPVNSEVAEVKADQDPGSVDQLIEDLARKKDFGFDSNSAAEKPQKKSQSINQPKRWECPGTAEERLEFLKWKGDRLVAAGKCSRAEAESYALAWANRHPEEATLAYGGWKREINQKVGSAETSRPLVSAIPNFPLESRDWHKKLITAYRQEGEQVFLARETWHKNWLKYARTYLRKELEG